jgi:hypothetical protein
MRNLMKSIFVAWFIKLSIKLTSINDFFILSFFRKDINIRNLDLF